jgi:hypothetical protein
MPQSLDALLTRLEAAKSRDGRGAAAETRKLLSQLRHHNFRDPQPLLRFHEALLFLRAFPQSASLVPQIEQLLNTFHIRIERLQASGADMSVFDDFDTSGIAGTTMQDTLNFEAARWLVRRIPRNVGIAWNDYWDEDYSERAVGSTWPRFIPLLEEDADVEANIPWRSWIAAARGRERDLEWLIRQFEQLPVTDRERAELYDSLRILVRWHLHNLKLSRTRNWTRPRRLYSHDAPLIIRSEVSLARELSQPAPRLTKLSRREGESILTLIREIMLVRYRELYGTTLGDPLSVLRADLGRGVVIHLWNLPPDRRLPLRAYVAGFTLKNGVPINYVEAIGLCEWIEVGFNTFYTYRQGETAWIYAQALRCLHAFTGATTISIYPYQIGQNNDEALDSGAFWFYRKLGFRCSRADLEALAKIEEQKIAAKPQYRTPRKTLKQLSEAHVFYELETPRNRSAATADSARIGKGTTSIRTVSSAKMLPAAAAERPWDTFSTRNLALRVNRRMAREFNGGATAIRESSLRTVSRALQLDPTNWTPNQRRCLENWSLILALIPDLAQWSPEQKHDLIRIIQTQSAGNEMRYLRLTQRHPRLRAALLSLGSNPSGHD